MHRSAPVSSDPARLATAALCLLLTLLPGLGLPLLAAGDHHHEHDSGAASRELVVLHHGDGDPHHAAPRLEHGEPEFHAPCVLCARLGKTLVLAPQPSRVSVDLAPRRAAAIDFVPLAAGEEYDSCQPRAPPRA